LLATVDLAVCGEVKAGWIQDCADVIRYLSRSGSACRDRAKIISR
jgi:hypothetical protein